MKSYRRYIRSAADVEDTRLKDAIDEVEDDFDYAISGLEKLGRGDKQSYEAALSIVQGLSNALAQVIDRIADEIQEVE